MTFFPDMRTFVDFGGLRVTWYAIIILTGAFLAYYLTIRQVKKWGYDEEVFENFFLMMLPISIIGARIYYVIFEWNNLYASNPISAFYIWEGGLAIHGGVIAGTLFGIWYFHRHQISGLRIADVIFPNLMLAQAIGRWGNFMNQEAFGQIVNPSFYEHWPAFIRDQMYIDGYYRQPTFLFESVGNLIGYFLITKVYKKYGRKKRGDLMFAYFAWYGMVRFFVEGLRTDALMLGPLRIAQVVSLIGVLIGILGIWGVFDKMFKNVWPFKHRQPAIIFDLDGTLIDSKELIYASFKHTFEKFMPDHTLTEEELQSFFGPALKETFLRYFDEETANEAVLYYREFNKSNHDAYIKEVPHVKETLSYLKKENYPLAVFSNKYSEVVHMGLKATGLEEYFDVVLGGEQIQEAKPSPSGILEACKKLYVPTDDVIYVGDSKIDIQACKNMGGYSVAFILDQTREEEMKKEHPCKVIYNMNELIPLLKENLEWSDTTI